MRSEEKQRAVGTETAMRGNVCQPGAVEGSQHPFRGCLGTGQQCDVLIERRYQRNFGTVSDQPRPTGQRDPSSPRRRGGLCPYPGGRGGRDAEMRPPSAGSSAQGIVGSSPAGR